MLPAIPLALNFIASGECSNPCTKSQGAAAMPLVYRWDLIYALGPTKARLG